MHHNTHRLLWQYFWMQSEWQVGDVQLMRTITHAFGQMRRMNHFLEAMLVALAAVQSKLSSLPATFTEFETMFGEVVASLPIGQQSVIWTLFLTHLTPKLSSTSDIHQDCLFTEIYWLHDL
jgi:hypothetical protein